MKKTTVILLVLFGALCAIALSCASTGGAKGGDAPQGVPALGTWYTYDDHEPPNNGTSTCTMTETSEDGMTAYHFAWEVTSKFIYGFAGFGYTPDDDAKEKLKTTVNGITFKVKGDGQRYAVKYMTDDIADYSYYEYVFGTDKDKTVTIDVPMKYFMQPSWGIYKKLNRDRFFEIQWQTTNNGKPGTGELTVWDLQLY